MPEIAKHSGRACSLDTARPRTLENNYDDFVRRGRELFAEEMNKRAHGDKQKGKTPSPGGI